MRRAMRAKTIFMMAWVFIDSAIALTNACAATDRTEQSTPRGRGESLVGVHPAFGAEGEDVSSAVTADADERVAPVVLRVDAVQLEALAHAATGENGELPGVDCLREASASRTTLLVSRLRLPQPLRLAPLQRVLGLAVV